MARQLQRHTLVDGPFALLATAHGQVGLPVEAVHTLVIDPGKLWAQQVVDAPIAKAATHVRDLHDARLAEIEQQIAQLTALRDTIAELRHDAAQPDPDSCSADQVCRYL